MSIIEKKPKDKLKLRRKRGRPPGTTGTEYARPDQRGLGPDGGGWNISQAARWSGIGESSLRNMIRRKRAGESINIFPHYQLGRRTLIPREGFKAWFNRSQDPAV